MRISKVIRKIKDEREFRAYVIWGAVSSLLNIVLFRILILIQLEYRIANIITLLTVRIFCYITNKHFVFKTKTESVSAWLKEIGLFFLVRMATFFIDYYGVILLVETMKIDSFVSKVFMAIFVIVCNYFFSKFLVFKK